MAEEETTPEAEQQAPAPEAAPTSDTPKKEEAPKPSKEPERQDITTLHERTIAAMSYFGFLAVVPFYLKKDSEFCQFHGKQGMFLAIFFFMTKLFTVVDLLFDLMLLLQVVLLFIMGFAALSGRWRKIPFGYNWSCQLEEVLTLKTKEEEEAEVGLKPNAVKEGEDQAPEEKK